MQGFHWFLSALSRPFTYKGRARRAEFGWFMLIFNIITIPITLLAADSPFLYYLFILVYIFPSISVTTRRLHDLGFSGWLQIPLNLLELYLFVTPTSVNSMNGLMIMTVIVFAILCYLALKDGERKDNEYGKDPKALV